MKRCGTPILAILAFCALAACGTDGSHEGDVCTDCNPELLDGDGDGFTPAGGDCDDADAGVNPQALEDYGPSGAGDGVDDDCDGATDETDPCLCTDSTGTNTRALDCAAEISCDSRFIVTGSTLTSPTGYDVSNSFEALTHFGDPDNDLEPVRGFSYTYLTTGVIGTDPHSTMLQGGAAAADPFGHPLDSMLDAIAYTVELEAPRNAVGFSVDYIFFSAEYDDWVADEKNDKFYIILNGPTSTGGQDKVINYTECRDATNYHDFDENGGCDLPSGYCCYVAINSALSECCWFPHNSARIPGSDALPPCPDGPATTNIDGTGFECASSAAVDSGMYGSSTGWLQTRAAVAPGERFTLTFHLHDTDDQVFDSSVIIDNFRWQTVAIEGGTAPIQGLE